MQKRPSTAHVVLRYEQIDKGKFAPTYNQVGTIDEAEAYLTAHAADMVERVNQRDDQRNPQLVVKLGIEIPVESIAEARRLADAEWAPVNLPEPVPMVARIPGAVHATYKDGKIDKIWFSPAASGIGYFGPSFEVVDHAESYPDEEDDRPFWAAVQRYLDPAGEARFIEWEE